MGGSEKQKVIVYPETARECPAGAGCWSHVVGLVRPESATLFDEGDIAGLSALPGEAVGSGPGYAVSLRDARILCDSCLMPRQLDDVYNPDGDGGHPDFPRSDWRERVANEDTISGYWVWVRHWLLNEADDIRANLESGANQPSDAGPSP